MNKKVLVDEIRSSQECFERSTRVLAEENSEFRPTAEMMTVAQQVAHVAHSIHWLLDGATKSEGFDMNFAKHAEMLKSAHSLKESRSEVQKAFERCLSLLETLSEEDLQARLPEGPVMGGAPRLVAFLGVVEHTAHHRGALTVYSRLLNKTPLMPYMEM